MKLHKATVYYFNKSSARGSLPLHFKYILENDEYISTIIVDENSVEIEKVGDFTQEQCEKYFKENNG